MNSFHDLIPLIIPVEFSEADQERAKIAGILRPGVRILGDLGLAQVMDMTWQLPVPAGSKDLFALHLYLG